MTDRHPDAFEARVLTLLRRRPRDGEAWWRGFMTGLGTAVLAAFLSFWVLALVVAR